MSPYPSVGDFKDALLSKPLGQVVQESIFAGLPYVFRDRPDSLDVLKQHLCQEIGLSQENVIVVGSAKIGFSLNPDNFPRQFSNDSDIDVLAVDERLFDEVWTTLLKWNYPRRLVKLAKVDSEWVWSRRKDIYWGWFVPDQIRFEGISFPDALSPVRDLSTKWFNAFRGLSRFIEHPELASREVSGRLYRTWDHALLYHEEGLRLLKTVAHIPEGGP